MADEEQHSGKPLPIQSAHDYDNWTDRATTMVCNTCMYYVPKVGSSLGRCRRNAPTMKGFVPVYPTDWCGEHRLDL